MDKTIRRRKFLSCLLTSRIFLIGSGSNAVSLLCGCQKERTVDVDSVYSFLDSLNEAEVVTPKKEYVREAVFTIDGEGRRVLCEHPDSQITFKGVSIHQNARLAFGIGINELAWDKVGDGVLFEVILVNEKQKEHFVFSRYIDPKNKPDDRKWFNEEAGLTAFEDTEVAFIFKTSSGPKKNDSSVWAVWSEPKLYCSKGTRVRTKKNDHINVVLIVIDTLRADHLGCYGNKSIKTPHIDQVAAEGVLFENHFSKIRT